MRLRFVWVGKTKSGAVKELVDDYLARVRRFARVEVSELRDPDVGADARRALEKEGQDILSQVGPDPYVVLLDERGRELNSAGLADLIGGHRARGTKQITFVLGGHRGVSDAVKGRADFALALSRMTLTHEFARALLVEQVYRAWTILHGLPYQK
jgi:23S rRNA (pseudouridine1915-N3)-methyltransferase